MPIIEIGMHIRETRGRLGLLFIRTITSAASLTNFPETNPHLVYVPGGNVKLYLSYGNA